MLHGDEQWRDLFRCDGLPQARAVATSIEAMEYDVRVIDVATGRPVTDAAGADPGGGFVVQTRPEEAVELHEVLDQIIAEQVDFDDYLDRRDEVRLSRQRVFLGVLITIVSVLAMLRMIDV